jgi:hypothetical protein
LSRKENKLIGLLFDELGLSGADLLNAKCIIWIEGPSDRIYIKKWLELKQLSEGSDYYREGIDYVFATYGAILEVLKPETLLSINKHNFVLIDKDSAEEQELPTDSKKVQTKLLLEANDINAFITQKYTIESYLPREVLISKGFKESGVRENPNLKKVPVSIDITNEFSTWDASYSVATNL